jgi:Purple acid Phosphatase, N-terminal domain/Calcineurin-like phosphoesterase
MQTPYGEIPDKFARDMRPQEMHDFLRKRYGRRTVLKGAGIAAAAVAAGPIFWKQADVFAAGSSTTTTPQWIGYGSNPATSLWVSWTDGSAGASPSPVPTATSGQPNSAVLMYATSLTTLQANGGQVVPASLIGQVPIPSGQPSGNVDDTYYISVLLTGLTPGTKYYYQVSNNNGTTWNPSAYFTTAPSTVGNFTFCATGDEYEASSTASVVASILAYDPAFTIVAGDLSYASGGTATLGKTAGANDGNTAQQSYSPGEWDTYFSYMGESAQFIPWLVGVGNHEMEPLTVDGYAGILTRFPDLAQQANGGSNTTESGSTFTYTGSSFTWNGYTITNGTTYNSGSPVVRTYTYGNVAFIQLDGNDLSAEISENNGYTGGQQTNWLLAQLATYRAGASVDFIVVYFHNCLYCTNGTHGSDGGIRNVWQPIFDNWNVDLVVNGHVHAYERSQPLFNNAPVKQVASGGSYTNFYTDQGALTPPSGAISATTYFCAGGGGQSLYTSWLGFSGGDDGTSGDGSVTGDTNAAANTFTTGSSPFLDVWKVSGTVEPGTATGAPAGATGVASGGSTENDPAYSAAAPFSAWRFSTWSHLTINVTAPTSTGGQTSMQILGVDANVSPTVVMDSVTIIRDSVVQPPAATPEVGATDLLVVAGAAVMGAGAYAAQRKAAKRREHIYVTNPNQPLN